MISILKRIFSEKGFILKHDLLDSENHFFAERYSKNQFDFYLVLFEKISDTSLKEIRDKIDEYKSLILLDNQDVLGIDKNLSLLIVLNVLDERDENKIVNFIYDIEEDPYDFKKYVLPYDNEQLKILRDNTNGISDNEFISYLRNRLHNSEIFSSFKNNENVDEAKEFDLISKFFIKLPFLTINYEEKEVKDLEQEIRDGLDESHLKILDVLLDYSESEEFDLENILKLVEEVEK
ncbi:ABC-three component system middle component 1 [Halobacillus sp. HZG1]|uniref:ABC-three component system middle component 1 n=1 Tax=Halobacillus sp. HZG1 TaxID=3111769 RepID=UPI002DB6624D|nr:ABC-three component system middle component 1 [Halobacillus sp. HZG1]MEC3885165.1 ABC-three component system middle component 1 [Halobacillus sp. HZG1]